MPNRRRLVFALDADAVVIDPEAHIAVASFGPDVEPGCDSMCHELNAVR